MSRGNVAGKFNSMLEHPRLAARPRQRVAPDALVRRDQLDDTARVELFRELAEFPAETVADLSDEHMCGIQWRFCTAAGERFAGSNC